MTAAQESDTDGDLVRTYFVQGTLVTDRLAYLLVRTPQFNQMRATVRGGDRDVDDLLITISKRGRAWRDYVDVSTLRKSAEVPVKWFTPAEVANQTGVTGHAVRLAIREGRLPATKIDGRWQISPADLVAYRKITR